MKPTEYDNENISPEGVEQFGRIMSSYRQILYHIVFRTKDSRETLEPEHSRELYAYLMGIIKKKNGILYRINGMDDYIHILCDLHPSIALADLLRDMKTASSIG